MWATKFHTHTNCCKILHVHLNIINIQTSPNHIFTFGHKSSSQHLALMSVSNNSHYSRNSLFYKTDISTPSLLCRIIWRRMTGVGTAPLQKTIFQISSTFRHFSVSSYSRSSNKRRLHKSLSTSPRYSQSPWASSYCPHLSHKTHTLFLPRS